MKELNRWINKPHHYRIDGSLISFDVLPKTDFWQVTHYGFSRTDGNCLVAEIDGDTCFTTKVTMNYLENFDQAGIMVYYNEENFAKLCIENQLEGKDKLGSVVCKNKRSDWATQSVDKIKEIYLRVSKRDHNFLFEFSLDGILYDQMRIFDMVGKNPYIGVFGASPLGQGFKAEFSNVSFNNNTWVLDLNDLPDALK